MTLIGLTKEQNEELRRLHVAIMDNVEENKKLADRGNTFAGKLALYQFAQVQAYLELGDFESDPRLPEYVGKL